MNSSANILDIQKMIQAQKQQKAEKLKQDKAA